MQAKYEWNLLKTADFFVSVDVGSQDKFYDESIWPVGTELRDWYLKNGEQK